MRDATDAASLPSVIGINETLSQLLGVFDRPSSEESALELQRWIKHTHSPELQSQLHAIRTSFNATSGATLVSVPAMIVALPMVVLLIIAARCLYLSNSDDDPEPVEQMVHGLTPDESDHNGQWLNDLNRAFWPGVRSWLKDLVEFEVVPSIKASLPTPLNSSCCLSEFILGDSYPIIYNVKVQETADAGATGETRSTLSLCLDVRWKSDVKICFALGMGATVGVSKLHFHGLLALTCRNLSATPPFFCGLDISFVNPPKLDIDFTGVANLHVVPNIIRSAIDKCIADVCVIPNRIALDMNPEDTVDWADMRFPNPYAVLEFTLLRGNGLLPGDFSIMGGRSDPYVVASLGSKRWTSPTASGLSPVWGEEGKGVTTYFALHNELQRMKLQIFDADLMGDDLMSELSDICLQDLTANHEVQMQLMKAADTSAKAGRLMISAEIKKLSPFAMPALHRSHEHSDLSGRVTSSAIEHPVYISAKVLEIVNVTNVSKAPVKVRVSACGEHATSWSGFAKVISRATAALVPAVSKMYKRGMSKKDIAFSLDISALNVDKCLLLADDNIHHIGGVFIADPKLEEDAKRKLLKFVKEAKAQAALERPQFEQVLQVLLPAPVPAECEVHVQVFDGNDKDLGSCNISLSSIRQHGGEHPGPFALNTGAELIATVRAMSVA